MHTRTVRLLRYVAGSASGVALRVKVPAAEKPKRVSHAATLVLLMVTLKAACVALHVAASAHTTRSSACARAICS